MSLSLIKKNNLKSNENSNHAAVKKWLPFKDIVNGIVVLKNGQYVKILEVTPINFKLKSKKEKKMIILNYRSFLKACRFPMQISIQSKKADIDPHVNKMQEHYKRETNNNAKSLINGYINLVRSLGSKGAVSRRFFLVFTFTPPVGVKNVEFKDVDKQLSEKKAKIIDYLKPCGNIIVDTGETNDTVFVSNVLYTYLNRRTCEVQKFGNKFLKLTGITFASKEDKECS